jgi:hypothetical protein
MGRDTACRDPQWCVSRSGPGKPARADCGSGYEWNPSLRRDPYGRRIVCSLGRIIYARVPLVRRSVVAGADVGL